MKELRQKIKAFNMDLDAIKIKFNVELDEIYATFDPNPKVKQVRSLPYFEICEMYRLWELMDARIPREQKHCACKKEFK